VTDPLPLLEPSIWYWTVVDLHLKRRDVGAALRACCSSYQRVKIILFPGGALCNITN